MFAKFFLFFLLYIYSNSLFSDFSDNSFIWAKNLLYKGATLDISGKFWKSNGYFRANGEAVGYNDQDSFSYIEQNTKIRYGLSRKIELGVGNTYRSVQSNENSNTMENSGIDLIRLYSKYYFNTTGKQKTRYALLLGYGHSINKNNYYTTSIDPDEPIVIGDDANFFDMGIVISHGKKHIVNFLVDYIHYNENLSPEVYYDIQSKWLFRKSSVAIGAYGIYSLKTDEYADEPNSKPAVQRGITRLYNSINREYIAPYALFNWKLGVVNAYLKGFQVIRGNDTDRGFGISTGFIIPIKKGKTYASTVVNKFKNYHLEASIVTVSNSGMFFRIDKGAYSGVEINMLFDIYETDFFEKNNLIARGKVVRIKQSTAIVKIVQRYKDVDIKIGFTVRGNTNLP